MNERLAELARRLLPMAGEIEAARAVPPTVLDCLARSGALAALVPARYGGQPLSHREYGELNRAVARASASVQSLLTVHAMVCASLSRWGPEDLRRELLPRLARGEPLAAFALTEDGAGSDAQAVATTARRDGDGWRLSGTKRWLSFGQVAGVFLVFAVDGERSVAFLVCRTDPGVTTQPSRPTSGFRSAMLADLHLDDCRLPPGRMVGRPGFGVAQVASGALSLGRLCVAYGSVGLAAECCDAALAHTSDRRQFGARLLDLQLVRGLVSDAVTGTEAARLLCERAAAEMDAQGDWLAWRVLMAKLAASRAAGAAAEAAAQLHGALGLVDGGTVDRCVRDARVMQVIEGSTQLVQHLLAEESLKRLRVRRRRSGHPFPGGAEDAD